MNKKASIAAVAASFAAGAAIAAFLASGVREPDAKAGTGRNSGSDAVLSADPKASERALRHRIAGLEKGNAELRARLERESARRAAAASLGFSGDEADEIANTLYGIRESTDPRNYSEAGREVTVDVNEDGSPRLVIGRRPAKEE